MASISRRRFYPTSNLYDNASRASFMKTLKWEEIYANRYLDLDHLRADFAALIEQYCNWVVRA